MSSNTTVPRRTPAFLARSAALLASVSVSILALSACGGGSTVRITSDGEGDAALATQPQQASPGGDAATSSTSPIQTEKERRWQDAIRGLHFDTGRLVVDMRDTLNQQQAEASFLQGQAEFAKGDFIMAIHHYRDALALGYDDTRAVMELAEALHMKGRIAWEIASLRTVLDVQPDNVDARINLANALWMTDQQADAVAEMEAAVELDPNRAAAHERLAVWNYYLGNDAAAWEHVDATRALGSDVPPQLLPLLEARTPDPGAGE